MDTQKAEWTYWKGFCTATVVNWHYSQKAIMGDTKFKTNSTTTEEDSKEDTVGDAIDNFLLTNAANTLVLVTIISANFTL